MAKAWGMAGPSRVCKSLRSGFDSLPRLHKRSWWFRAGERAGIWVLTRKRSPFWAGMQYASFKHKRHYPAGSGGRAYRLMLKKHDDMTVALTNLDNLREKHIAMSKELSTLKRAAKHKEQTT